MICLRAPKRVERYLALNIAPPFVPISRRALASLWRFWYQWAIASPVVGEAVVRRIGSGNPVFRWVGAGPRAWTPAGREAFLGHFREPARARASVQYYRSFTAREMPAILRGRYRRTRLRTPTRLVFGTDDAVISSRGLEAVDGHADDMRVEFVHGVGHLIADERPDLVLDRALSFFG